MRWLATKDGIWPTFHSEDMRMIVTQYGPAHWRWTIYRAHVGTTKVASGTAANERAAKRAAVVGNDNMRMENQCA